MRNKIYLAFILLPATQTLALTWTESVNGDLSDNASAPTNITFDVGVNTISGRMGDDEPGVSLPSNPPLDRDIFTFTLAPQQFLTSINVRTFEPRSRSFYAIASGSSISLDNGSLHMGNMLLSATGEILPTLSSPGEFGALGFPTPLGAGTYTIWFQEAGNLVNYSFDYTVAVPEPQSLTVIAAGALALRRTRKLRA